MKDLKKKLERKEIRKKNWTDTYHRITKCFCALATHFNWMAYRLCVECSGELSCALFMCSTCIKLFRFVGNSDVCYSDHSTVLPVFFYFFACFLLAFNDSQYFFNLFEVFPIYLSCSMHAIMWNCVDVKNVRVFFLLLFCYFSCCQIFSICSR